MQNAGMWLASIFGPFLVILGLWMLFYGEQMAKVCAGTKASPALLYLNSVFNILVGFTILSQYDLWGWNLLSLVSLLGWFMVLRGLMGLFVPQLFIDLFSGKSKQHKAFGLIPLIWGVLLSYAGFFM